MAYGVPLAALFVALVLLFWGVATDSWTHVSGANGRREITVGLVRYLEIVTEPVALDGTRGPGFTRTLHWRPGGITGDALLTAVAAVLAAWLFRWLVRRDPLMGRCDACGYDLRGTHGAVCPECGSQIRPMMGTSARSP
jgi:hypothetical protein